MRKMIFLLITMIILFSLSVCSAEENNRFIVVEENETGTWAFDSSSVKFGKDNQGKVDPFIIDAWIKTTFTEEYKKTNTRNPTLTYMLSHTQFDMRNKKFRSLKLLFYDDSHKLLYNFSYDNSELEDIVPETFNEVLSAKIGHWILNNIETIKERSYR